MKKSLVLIFCLLMIHDLKAKTDEDSTNRLVKNMCYLEALGIGGFGSLNYERIIFKKRNFLTGAPIGFSTHHLFDFTNKLNPDIIVPIALSGLYGKQHKIEFGIGQTFVNIVHVGNSDLNSKRQTRMDANFTIGYRYQKENGGLIFRCAYTPMIQDYARYRHWGGISIGYAF